MAALWLGQQVPTLHTCQSPGKVSLPGTQPRSLGHKGPTHFLSHNIPFPPRVSQVCLQGSRVCQESLSGERRSISFMLLTVHGFSMIWDSDPHPWQNLPHKEYDEAGVWTKGSQAALPTPPLTPSMNTDKQGLWHEGPSLKSYGTR